MTKQGELIPAASTPEPAMTATRVIDLLAHAIDKNMTVEGLEKLVALHERIADRAASLEFSDALARFQAKCPPIAKTAEAKAGVTRSGGQFGGYRYAPLDEVARTVQPYLAAEGLSYSWDTTFTEDGRTITVTCTLRHRGGHSITSKFQAPTEVVTQAMSPQQRVANAQSYGRRYTLIAVLGLSTCDPDEDGAPEDVGTITPAQVEILEALIDKRPSGARERILKYLHVEALEEIPASRFDWLKNDLEQHIAKDSQR